MTIIEEGEFSTHASIDVSSIQNGWEKASACHSSQFGGLPRNVLMGWIFRWLNYREYSMRAIHLGEPGPSKCELFASLDQCS